MRKINKDCSLSTTYKKWEQQLEDNEQPHPKYNSSNGTYYWDIVMQLFVCQEGLCAYTEQRLCSEQEFKAEYWIDGKYAKVITNPKQWFGQLEHFDESLKAKKGDEIGKKDWLWDNLFMVHSDINNRKGTKVVDNIMKPDKPNYDPFQLLEYDIETHVYLPHQQLDEELTSRVARMIDVLCINHVSRIREEFLDDYIRLVELGVRADQPPNQFPTAYEMYKKQNQ